MHILETLAPVFLVVALGYGLRRRDWLSEAFIAESNRLVFWVGLPAFLFISLATPGPESVPARGLIIMTLAATGLMLAVAPLAGRLLGVRPGALGTFVQASFRGNLAYVALPVIALLPAGAGPMRNAALVALVPLLVVYNTIGVAVLLASQPRSGSMWRPVAVEVGRNPLFWASVLGGWVGWAGGEVPVWIGRTMQVVGQMSLPLALLCIGGVLATTKLQGNRGNAVTSSLLKTVGQPLLGLGVAYFLGLGPDELQIGLVILAVPTAGATYTLVSQLGGDTTLAASAVVLSTLCSLVVLAVIVGAF